MEDIQADILREASEEIAGALEKMRRVGGSRDTITDIKTYLTGQINRAIRDELSPLEKFALAAQIRLISEQADIRLKLKKIGAVLHPHEDALDQLLAEEAAWQQAEEEKEQMRQQAEMEKRQASEKEKILRERTRIRQEELDHQLRRALGKRFVSVQEASSVAQSSRPDCPLPELDAEKLSRMQGIEQFLLMPSLPLNIRHFASNMRTRTVLLEPEKLTEILGKDSCNRGEHTNVEPQSDWYFFCAFETGNPQKFPIGTMCRAADLHAAEYDLSKAELKKPTAAVALQAHIFHRDVFKRWIGGEGTSGRIECSDMDETGDGPLSPHTPLLVPVVVAPHQQKLFVGTSDVYDNLQHEIFCGNYRGTGKKSLMQWFVRVFWKTKE